MPTHFHFCIRVKEEIETTKVSEAFVVSSTPKKSPKLTPLEKAFRDFFISYAKSINKAYHRTGSLFQYKFKRKPILNQNYLTRLILYIHANPITAGLSKTYTEWEFSSYNTILSHAPSSIERNDVLHLFGGQKKFISLHEEYANERIFDEKDEEFNQLVRW